MNPKIVSKWLLVTLLCAISNVGAIGQTIAASSRFNDQEIAGSKYDQYTKATGIATRNYQLPSDDIGASFFSPRSARAILMGRVTDSYQEGFELRIIYQDSTGWSFFSVVHDIDGVSLPLTVVSRDVLYGSHIQEEFGISLSREYLVKSKTTGFNLRVNGKSGKIFIKYPAEEIVGFLEVLENVEAQVRNKVFAVPMGDGTKPRLGVRAVPVDARTAQILNLPAPVGVVIVFVTPGSPAEGAGIKVGDVVLGYNGADVPPTMTGLADLVSTSAPKGTAKVKLRRGSDDIEVAVSY